MPRGARRMAQSAALLVDEVIPQVPVRQWVLSFPIGLRILFAARPELLTPVLRIVHRVIAGFLLKQAGLKRATADTGVPSGEYAHGAPARMGWACLLKRVFDIDLEHCPQCGGAFRIIAAIEAPAVIVKILTHLGLPARAEGVAFHAG